MNDLSHSLFKSPLFYPLSWSWEKVYQLRRHFYNTGILEQKEFDIPMISVGNVTFGGTGKTPFTIFLSEYIERLGLTPLVLTRGYKGGMEHSSGVIKGGDVFKFNPSSYGDEPLLIARKLTRGAVAVGKNRSANFLRYFEELKPDVGILDDGFQHLKIYRDLNIVLFDALAPMNSYAIAPKGYLREGLPALSDADLVVLSRSDLVSRQKVETLEAMIKDSAKKDLPICHIGYKPTGLYDSFHRPFMDLTELGKKKVVCAIALGSPSSFMKQIEKLGCSIVGRFVYPDHHFYTKQDLEEIIEVAKREDALIITSEKDIVKIQKVSRGVEAYYLGIEIDFQSGWEVFEGLLQKSLKGVLI